MNTCYDLEKKFRQNVETIRKSIAEILAGGKWPMKNALTDSLVVNTEKKKKKNRECEARSIETIQVESKGEKANKTEHQWPLGQ